MTTVRALLLALALITFTSAAGFEAGLFSPIQVAGPSESVDGARIGFVYTKNASVTGVDFNIFVGHTTGNFDGVRIWGLVNYTEGGANGASIFNGVNFTKGASNAITAFSFADINTSSVKGARINIAFNYAESLDGVDFAFINAAKKVKGVQIGVFNYAESIDGFQIGLVNVAMNSDIFPVLPLVNSVTSAYACDTER